MADKKDIDRISISFLFVSTVINRQGRNPFSKEEKGQKPSNTKRTKRTRELMNGRQARGNKAKCRLNRPNTGGKPANKRGSRPLMSVQHSRVCLSVIARVHTYSKLQHTAEWANAHAHRMRTHARKVRGRVRPIVHAPACRT